MKQKSKYFSALPVAAGWWAWLPLGAVIGSAIAFFMWALHVVSSLRQTNGWLLFLLPPAGVIIYFLYRIWGQETTRGNDLVIEAIHQPAARVPARMAPLVLAGTLVSHLFGASVGREGTAVQMGGGIASILCQWLRIDARERPLMLCIGVAAGFGAVFGTPLAGALFAMEVLAIGGLRARKGIGGMGYWAIVPCLLAALTGHYTCLSLGARHLVYPVHFSLDRATLVSPSFWWPLMLLGVLAGMVARLFTYFLHVLKKVGHHIPARGHWVLPLIGGGLTIALVYLFGTRDYLGLGDVAATDTGVSILSAFQRGGVPPYAWLLKLLFTSVALAFGFKGGEVTPLFFMGACLGNAVASFAGAPTDLLAGLGFLAVFAGASNTPIACTLMGIELFGVGNAPCYALVCMLAYFTSGHKGIYGTQRVLRKKGQYFSRNLPR